MKENGITCKKIAKMRQRTLDVHLRFAEESARDAVTWAAIHKALSTITPREERYIRIRCGWYDGTIHTYNSIAPEVSVERTRQVIAQAQRKIRHQARLGFSLYIDFILAFMAMHHAEKGLPFPMPHFD
jgi:hypothetical protein